MKKARDLNLIFSVLLSVLAFICLSIGTRFPILADDYYWMNIPLSHPQFKLTDLYIFSRMPTSGLTFLLTLKAGIWETLPKTCLIFFFAIHSLAFAILFRGALKEAHLTGPNVPIAFVIACTVFTLQPNNYEIHLWHLLSMHALGALFIALSFRYNGKIAPIIGTLGIVVGLLTYDTFIFLLGGLMGLSLLISRNSRKIDFQRKTKSFILIGLVSFGLWICVKIALGRLMGFLQVPPFEHSFPNILDHTKTVLKIMGLIHFYKINWILSLCEWVAIGLLVTSILRNRYLPKSQVFMLLLLPFVVAAPLSLNTYSAQRAFYGPQMIQGLVLAFLLYVLISSTPKNQNKTWITICLLFGITYVGQWEMIMNIKRRNYDLLEKEKLSLQAMMASCVSPCTFKVPPPGAGVKGDYVLPQFVWNDYYERIRLRSFPEKQIHFEVSR